VGDPGHQCSQRLHFLGLVKMPLAFLERLLGLALFTHVLANQHGGSALKRKGPDIDPKPAAVMIAPGFEFGSKFGNSAVDHRLNAFSQLFHLARRHGGRHAAPE
jgi:hypothetical protein